MKEFTTSLTQYLEGLQGQITRKSQDLHALHLEIVEVQNTLHQIEQGNFGYEIIQKESKMNQPTRET